MSNPKRSIRDFFSAKSQSKKTKPAETDDSESATSNVETETDIIEDEDTVTSESDSEYEDYEDWVARLKTNSKASDGGEPSSSAADSSQATKLIPGPTDIAHAATGKPCQPFLKSYPQTLYGKDWRGFKTSWYAKYPWIEYSVKANAVFCFPCRFFSVNPAENAFTETGFSNWKNALTKDKGLTQHNCSSTHKSCQVGWEAFKESERGGKSVSAQINTQHLELVKENFEYMTAVCDVLLFTAVQGIAQRGNDETQDSNNRGNFLELLNMLSKYNQIVKKKLEFGPKNAKYTHSSIQNELLHIMSRMVLQHIRDEVREAKYFALLVDESKDITKVEQLSVVLRFYFNDSVHERFIGFHSASSLDAESLFKYIKETLADSGIDINNCVGQTYDGASVMSGHLNGVQALLRKEIPQAIYVHCFNHRLNLVIVDVCKKIKRAANFFTLVQDLYVFLSGSSTHAQFVETQKKVHPHGKVFELKKICDTRWACQVSACYAIKRTFSSVLVTLFQLSNGRDERSAQARGLFHQLDMEFIVVLCMFHKILTVLKSVSDFLQSADCDFVQAVTTVGGVIDIFHDYRSSSTECFHEIWEEAEAVAKTNNIEETSKEIHRVRRLPQTLRDFIVLEGAGVVEDSDSSEDGMKCHVFIPVLERIINELERRFTDHDSILSGFSCLNPKSDSFLDIAKLTPLAAHYNCDISSLESEVKLLPKTLKRYESERGEKLISIPLLVKFLSAYKVVFSELHKLCVICLTIPASSASCERSFSCLRRLKTYLRNRIGNDRLSSLAILSIEKFLAKDLNLAAVVRTFGSQHRNARIVLQ